MAWNVDYDATALPAASSPAWTRTASAAPTVESVSGGVLRIAQTIGNSILYDLLDTVGTTYASGLVRARVKWAAGITNSNVALQARFKGRAWCNVRIISSTQFVVTTYDATPTGTDTTITVPDTDLSFHDLEIRYSAGEIRVLWDGAVVHTYSGAQYTGAPENRVYFGDFTTAADSASDSSWDSVHIEYPIVVVDPTIVATGGGTPTMSIERRARIMVATGVPGDVYKLHNAADTVLAQATVQGDGLATITWPYASTPVSGGSYVRGYAADGVTPNGKRWPSAGTDDLARDDRVYLARPETLGIGGVKVPAYNASNYYATSQYAGSNSQVVETTNHIFLAFRGGGPGTVWGGSYTDGINYVCRFSKATGLMDQAPVAVTTGITDGHEPFALARTSAGKLRFVSGGYAGGAIKIRESTNADDVSAWGAAASVTTTYNTAVWVYKLGTDDTGYLAFSTCVGGHLVLGTATAAAPTAFTFRTLGDHLGSAHSNDTFPGALMGDMFVAPGAAPVRVGIVFGIYDWGAVVGSPPYTQYKDTLYVETIDNGVTLRKADGTAIARPFAFPSDGSTPAVDVIFDGLSYGYWPKIELLDGQPAVLTDGDWATYGDWQKLARWNGTTWSIKDTPILSNDRGWAFGAPEGGGVARFGNWGNCMTVVGSTVFIFAADRGASADQGFRIVRWSSADYGDTWQETVVLDDTFLPYSYSWLTSSFAGAGFCYPKAPEGRASTVLFAAVDSNDATMLLAEWTNAVTMSTSGGGTPTMSDPFVLGAGGGAGGGRLLCGVGG